MIIVKLYGGLGNQLFQWAFGISMSKRRNTPVKFDISSFETDDLRNFELEKLLIRIEIATREEIQSAKSENNLLSRVIRKTRTIILPRIKRQQIFEQSFKFSSEIYDSKTPIYFDGYWQNENYFSELRSTILDSFKLDEFIDDHWSKKIKSSNSTSVHVRRTDYVTDESINESFGTCSIEYYKKAMNTILLKAPETVFFVFSDDIDWCKSTFNFVDQILFVDNTKNAITDFYLMQICNNNIIANSSFSWWAAWLNNNGNKQIIAPKIWFANSKFDSSQIVPKKWLRI